MEIDLDRLHALLNLMDENDLAELEIESGDFKVRLKKSGAHGAPEMVAVPALPSVAAHGAGLAAAAGGDAAGDLPVAAEPEDDLIEITSPMVGTFYRAPSPDADPYVQAGDALNEDTVVGLIEAMKVMNEIKAEVEGTLVEIKAQNGEAVEFGQVLFAVRPVG